VEGRQPSNFFFFDGKTAAAINRGGGGEENMDDISGTWVRVGAGSGMPGPFF
jgi:hypothetical protein